MKKLSMPQLTAIAMVIIMTAIAHLSSVCADSHTLKTDLGDLEIGGQWIYGDIEQGIALAKEQNKPLFVVFR